MGEPCTAVPIAVTSSLFLFVAAAVSVLPAATSIISFAPSICPVSSSPVSTGTASSPFLKNYASFSFRTADASVFFFLLSAMSFCACLPKSIKPKILHPALSASFTLLDGILNGILIARAYRLSQPSKPRFVTATSNARMIPPMPMPISSMPTPLPLPVSWMPTAILC